MPAPYTCPVLIWTLKTDKVDIVLAAHMNSVQTELAAINNRLMNLIHSEGGLLKGTAFPSPAVSTQLFHRIDLGQTYLRNDANTSWGLLTGANRAQIFTSNGSFVAPDGVTKVYLSMIGGGGGGSPGDGGQGGGGAGGYVINYPYTVVPGNSYAVVVGSGGAGGLGGGDLGDAGTASTFDATVTVPGGGAGNPGAGGGGYSSSSATGGLYAGQGGSGATLAKGMGGGGSPFGAGGNGSAVGPGSNAGANTGAGGGGTSKTGPTEAGGNGGSGLVIVMW